MRSGLFIATGGLVQNIEAERDRYRVVSIDL
jgi:hypothetical protein